MGSNEQITPVKVVCMVEGVVNDRPSELEYLSKMMKMHYDWFLYYQKAHDALVDIQSSGRSKELLAQVHTHLIIYCVGCTHNAWHI